MFLISAARCLVGESVRLELPSPNVVIDERPNNFNARDCRFTSVYHSNEIGETVVVVLTRTNDDKCSYHDGPFEFRVYDPGIEPVPNFNALTYIYMGVDGERAPPKTTELIIHASVKIVKSWAFSCCKKIKKCMMHDEVHTIESQAFSCCEDLMLIKLSKGLKRIGESAFLCCYSLKSLFIPHSIEAIESFAFHYCSNMRILSLPSNLHISQIGNGAFANCDTMLAKTGVPSYERDRKTFNYKNDEVHQSLLSLHFSLPPLHRECLNTNVCTRSIHRRISSYGPTVARIPNHEEMLPLHILAINPHVEEGALMTCFKANMSAAFIKDDEKLTPLDYLLMYHCIEYHSQLVATLCANREMMTRLTSDLGFSMFKE